MTPVANPGTTPFAGDLGLNDPTIGGDWVSYILGVTADEGSRIAAVDVDLKGVLHQRWNWDDETQIFGSTPSSLNVGNGDSHLLPISEALIAIRPQEDLQDSASYGSLPDVAGSIDYGVGTRMRGVWGIPGGNATSLNLAYVVIPRGSESQLEYAIDVAGPKGELSNFRQGASFPFPARPLPVPIPDPLPAPIANPIPPVTTLPPAPAPAPQLPLPPVETPPVASPPVTWGTPQLYASATQMLWSADNGLPAGFLAYQLSISTLDNSLIGAVDVRVNASLHQSWTDLDGDGNVDPTPRGLSTTGSDSHLIIPENGLTMPLAEDKANGAEGDGVGSQLGGAWGIPGESQSDTAQLAYLVVPDGLNFQDLDLNVGLALRKGDSISPVVNLSANNFNVLGADGALLSSAEPIEMPPVFVPPIPPIVDPPQEPPLAIDPPPIIPSIGELPPSFDPLPTIDLPPVAEEPQSEGGEIAIDDPVAPPPIEVPEIYIEHYPIYIPDELGREFVHEEGLLHFPWLHLLTDNDGLAELAVTGNGLNLTPRSGERGSLVVLRNFVAQSAVLFATNDFAVHSESAPGAPEPTSAVLVLLGSCLAACRAGRLRR